MFQFETSKHHTGLILWGDVWDLDEANTVIHEIVNKSIWIENKEGFVLGLAYDLRKAKEGMRRKSTREYSTDLVYPIFGVEIVWPVLLLQVAALRQASAYMDSTKQLQAVLYTLESVMESARHQDTPEHASHILQEATIIQGQPYNNLEEHHSSRCHYFLSLPPQKRMGALPWILQSLNPMYSSLYPILTKNQTEMSPFINPNIFTDIEKNDDDWPSVKF